jgi:hypothetical protein
MIGQLIKKQVDGVRSGVAIRKETMVEIASA